MFIEHFPSGRFFTTSIPPAGSTIPESSINITSTLPLMPLNPDVWLESWRSVGASQLLKT
jgi:hypothetical protein